MKSYLNELQQKLTTKAVTLNLPSSMTNLLADYASRGDIE